MVESKTLRDNIYISRRGLLAGAAVLIATGGLARSQQTAKPLAVLASFSILADLAKQVGGERVSVTALVGPNSDAHVYRATPADAKRVKDADVIVQNGLGFDAFMSRLIKSSGSKARSLIVTAGLKGIEKPKTSGHDHGHHHAHDHGKLDPHAWQSIEAASLFVTNIRDGLIAADGAGTEIYRTNAKRYLAELEKAKAEITSILAAIPRDNRLAIANHDAFRYFTQDFGIRIEGTRGLSTEVEPSAKDIARIVRIAREKKAKAVFLESIADPRIASQLAKESGAKLGGVLYSDALTDENGPAPTYIAMMLHNARTLAEALKD
ncbi:LraI ABC-type metal ion transport system, periplasmic component/surface adhesin [Rhabdaerophilaceae bacterium]